jgi:C_GCAxxG_C_C family probable redox protein
MEGDEMNLKERASENFKKGLNCSQSVFEASSGILGLESEEAKAIAAGFGAGIGKTQKTCGAVTGAVMAIGCKHYDSKDHKGSKKKVYAKTREFLNKFERIYGSTACRELLGIDIKTDKGQEEYDKNNMFEEKCQKYVQDACDILEEMI